MCSVPCLCAQIYVGCFAMCYFSPLSLDIFLSCLLALPVGCRSRSCVLGLHPPTYAYIKGFGSFPLHVYVFLFASMLYLHDSLSRSRFCHVLCTSWACACVIASVPLKICLGVTTCETHPRGVGVLGIHLSPLRAMLICFPCLLCTTRLAFLASLYLCTLAYMSIHESIVVHTSIRWSYGHSIQTYICPHRTHPFVW